MMKNWTRLLTLALFAGMFMTTIGCMGEVVPPGKVVIIVTPSGETAIHDKGVYKAYGRDKAYFVDAKLNSFQESLKILCQDDINMDVDVKVLMAFSVGKSDIDFIKSKVPTREVKQGEIDGFELSIDEFYARAVKDIVRSTARNVVSGFNTDDIRPNRKKIEADISAQIIKRIKDLKYPLNISAVMVSNIDYPESVKKMREEIKNVQLEEQRRAAETQAQLAAAQRMVAVETEQAKVRMIRAQAQADENAILTRSLTPQFLMWRQYEVMETVASSLANGSSNTVYMLPYNAINQETFNAALTRDAVSNIGKGTATPVKAE